MGNLFNTMQKKGRWRYGGRYLWWLLKGIGALCVGLLVTALLSVLYATYHTPHPQVVGQPSDHIIIKNVNIIDVNTGGLLPENNLLIQNGLIKQISKEAISTVPGGLVIEAEGKFLMPGLIDMHTHVIDRQDLLLALAHGVTHIRNMHGMKVHLAMREEVNAGRTIGPDLTVASMPFNQLSKMGSGFLEEVITSPEHARELVNYYHNEGYDLIKLYHGLQLDVFTAIVDESRKLNFPFAGHPSFFIDINEYLQSGAQSLEHVEMLYQAPLNYSDNAEALSALIEKLKAAQMPIDASIANFDHLAKIAQLKRSYINTIPLEYMNPLLRKLNTPSIDSAAATESPESWVAKSLYLGQISKALYDANVPVVLGSDAGAGYTLNGIGLIEEMQLLRRHNISAAKILHSGTVAGAKALNLNHAIGRVKVGMKANLILSEEDPRKDLTTFYHLAGIVKNGVYYNQASVEKMKEKARGHMPYFELLGWFLLGS